MRPAKKRDELVIFDRSFDDLLVDERRYRLQGTAWLVRILRRLLPRHGRDAGASGAGRSAAPAQAMNLMRWPGGGTATD